MLYNIINRSDDVKDPIEVYFDNQIGIIEVQTYDTEAKTKKETKVAQVPAPYGETKFAKIIAERNKQEAQIGELIKEFEAKVDDLFTFVRESNDGQRLIVKIKSHVNEDEIYSDFARLYRKRPLQK